MHRGFAIERADRPRHADGMFYALKFCKEPAGSSWCASLLLEKERSVKNTLTVLLSRLLAVSLLMGLLVSASGCRTGPYGYHHRYHDSYRHHGY